MLSYALTCGLLISLLTSRAVKNTLVYNNATTVHGGKLECFTVLILYYDKSKLIVILHYRQYYISGLRRVGPPWLHRHTWLLPEGAELTPQPPAPSPPGPQ